MIDSLRASTDKPDLEALRTAYDQAKAAERAAWAWDEANLGEKGHSPKYTAAWDAMMSARWEWKIAQEESEGTR